jgi:hypothetical protein
VSSTQCLEDDGVVEDLLWNSLDGNVLKQRGKDRSWEDLLPQKMQIVEIRVQLSASIQPPFKRMRQKALLDTAHLHRGNCRMEVAGCPNSPGEVQCC